MNVAGLAAIVPVVMLCAMVVVGTVVVVLITPVCRLGRGWAGIPHCKRRYTGHRHTYRSGHPRTSKRQRFRIMEQPTSFVLRKAHRQQRPRALASVGCASPDRAPYLRAVCSSLILSPL